MNLSFSCRIVNPGSENSRWTYIPLVSERTVPGKGLYWTVAVLENEEDPPY